MQEPSRGRGRTRASYGIDDPRVVQGLALIGALLASAGALAFISSFSSHSLFLTVAARFLAFAGLACVANAILLVFSSVVGKSHEFRRLASLLALGGGESVLDVGCGTGLLLVAAANRLTSGSAVGIDTWLGNRLSGNRYETALDNARIEGVAERIHLVKGDIRSLPFPDASFDVVLSGVRLHYLKRSSERRETLNEMVRVVKPGGKIAVLDLSNASETARVLRESDLTDLQVSGPRPYLFPPARTVFARKRFELVGEKET